MLFETVDFIPDINRVGVRLSSYYSECDILIDVVVVAV